MVLKLYFDPLSQPSRAVYLLLKANNIPFEEVVVSVAHAEHKTPEFAKVSPFGTVPAMDHDGFIMRDSLAILRYICRVFPVSDNWYPKDDVIAQAKIDEFLSWHHLNIRVLGCLTFQAVHQPIKFGEYTTLFGGTRETNLSKFTAFLDKLLTLTEGTFLAEGKFIAGGDKITIADLSCISELQQPLNGGIDITKNHPKLKAYIDRVTSALQPHYAEINGRAMKVTEELRSDPNLSHYHKYVHN